MVTNHTGPPVSVRLTASACCVAALSLLSADAWIMPISQRTTLRLGLMGLPRGRALTPRACLTADSPSAPRPQPPGGRVPSQELGPSLLTPDLRAAPPGPTLGFNKISFPLRFRQTPAWRTPRAAPRPPGN